MKAGKLSESILKRSVLRQLHNSAVRAPGVGIDFGAVDASAGKQIVTAEACRAFDTFPEAGVYAALNNLVCSGAKPLGITMTLLLPTSASENDLRAWISAVSRVSEKEQIPVLGGHTEVLRTVTSPQLIVQAVGEADRELFVTAAGAQPDMDVIVQRNTGKSYRPDTHSRFLTKRQNISIISRSVRRPQSPQSLALLQCTTSQREAFSELSGNWGSVPASDWKLI